MGTGNFQYIDKTSVLAIDGRGRLLQGGVKPVHPETDEKGYLVFTLPENRKVQRFVHVEVARHHGIAPGFRPGELKAEDVSFKDGDKANVWAGNLVLSAERAGAKKGAKSIAKEAEKEGAQVGKEPGAKSISTKRDEAEPDDLTQIKGVGPAYAKRIAAAGFVTFASLAEKSPAELANLLDIKEDKAAELVAQAKDKAGA